MLGRLLFIALVTGWPLSVSAQIPLPEGNVEPLNVPLDLDAGGGEASVIWSHREERVGSKYLRFHLSDIADASSVDYELKIVDRNNNEVLTISKAELAGKSEYWSGVIDGDYARIKLVAAQKPAGLRFRLTDLAYQKNMGAAFSITLPDDREPIVRYKDIPDIYGRARSIAKLTFIAGLSSAMCTGFLISEDRMLTNEHCINQAAVCNSLVAIFGYELDERNAVKVGEQHRCVKFLGSSSELDVAMIQLADKPGTKWGSLVLNQRKIVKDEQVYMIQHPQGEPKQISRKDCSVTTVLADGNATGTDFGHKCDTLQGSSGSPMLGSDFTVIGLHHFGFDAAADRWRAENRAVRMERLIDWVTQRL
ncbi:trypsin-like peptidase domain-containing protein [Bradyrhizobium sp. KBS0727]|uniref:trypsin-like serine peptidase n=1 Tax=unclassified Bradyrhizobium TaxID=2631580 RepID=UPI00110ED24C|nr:MULTISPECIES: serine protease [unclassified Bradyrhizobium]QDW35834.1 trypsin-like peptidase domain-containing protein [Bradyrhizobium sp. KBS0725]QDW42434.1 trypsin-like peptidase domain-containing protein [Bradyrhizobium sp. KBS0727]